MFNSENIRQKWPDLKYLPRPEPEDAKSKDHARWSAEYQHWRGLKCGGKWGYFCRKHGEWVSCSEVEQKLVCEQNQESESSCPVSHSQRSQSIAGTRATGGQRAQADHSSRTLEDQMNSLDIGDTAADDRPGRDSYLESSTYPGQEVHDSYFEPSTYPGQAVHDSYFEPSTYPGQAVHDSYFGPSTYPSQAVHDSYVEPSTYPAQTVQDGEAASSSAFTETPRDIEPPSSSTTYAASSAETSGADISTTLAGQPAMFSHEDEAVRTEHASQPHDAMHPEDAQQQGEPHQPASQYYYGSHPGASDTADHMSSPPHTYYASHYTDYGDGTHAQGHVSGQAHHGGGPEDEFQQPPSHYYGSHPGASSSAYYPEYYAGYRDGGHAQENVSGQGAEPSTFAYYGGGPDEGTSQKSTKKQRRRR
ncbi:hypothetical protein B0T26DRAFT_518417 [Lasiosphaeria miniovina]|uniref:Uncharacterized protein n=1 Tax=Lasiosphaeria miniovina TaxID=1954250 RepID=A0AA39ZUU7_9PEZI|nr:uncharacterized protein B0T26DRAFT_518417 [Lasiosphaeria miniovina]KAK0703950.1 hypothetical protein B0T26DRAFT_518417 [Lasiosphaeria miniovina]